MTKALADNGPVPIWERDWPGRYEYELNDLRAAGIAFDIDSDALASGVLAVDLSWIAPRGIFQLRAEYPDSFPWLRPQVYLRAPHSELPDRHCSPIDGQICLLGRDTRQWNTNWTLRVLLEEQLENALAGTGEEDPQGEPMEVWWNSIADNERKSFCLVDSDWMPNNVNGGYLEVLCSLDKAGSKPVLRACVVNVVSSEGAFSAQMGAPVIDLKQKIRVPWVHVCEPLVPSNDPADPMARALPLIHNHPRLQAANSQRFDKLHEGHLLAFSYPMEIAHNQMGTGWLFLLSMGKGLLPKKSNRQFHIVPTLRAGQSDLLVRNANAGKLLGKRVAVVGLGSIGAPIAVELAKNGCSELILVDYDKVEPGNTVRWVTGPSTWGGRKAAELKLFIEQLMPTCSVSAQVCMIGSPRLDAIIYETALKNCDLVVDVTASYGATNWLGFKCRGAKVPFLSAMATPDVSGGTVALFSPTGGCTRCLEHAQHQQDVPPFETKMNDPILQPPGCAERTFEGASYDLQELSLEAVRLSVAALHQCRSSKVATLRFEIDQDGERLPNWQIHQFGTYEKCGCNQYHQ